MNNQSINLEKNDDYIYIYINIVKGLTKRDLTTPVIILKNNISNKELGYSVRQGLNKSSILSSTISNEEFFLPFPPEIIQQYNDEEQRLVELNGFKKYKDFYKTLISVVCDTREHLPTLIITPLHTKRDNFIGFNDGSVDNVEINKDADDETLGKAIRVGFSRCKSIYKK